ncbi:MAG: hypothetical protein DHS20C18_45030 [Saprospiraceae bacterium]|nr:MAG: hypothetical protein DHS20C18_45030 [Saprospiraceae bacterium]
MPKLRFWPLLGGFLFALLCYFPLFLHLDSLSLRLWDESRRGVNALEMATNGHWLVPHFAGAPDMWGTKPPLLIWLQATFMKIVGYNELAVRLPSALAALATVFLLIWFAKRLLNRPLAGYLAGLVLLTSDIYIESHGAISGDYDTLLALWQTAYLFTFYRYLEDRQPKLLYLTGLFIFLAAFTKGIAGLFFLPALVVYAIFRKEFLPLLKNKSTYWTLLGVLIPLLGYYFLREAVNPGYLQAVWENELGGRYFEAKEGQEQPWWFYFRMIFKYELFSPWAYWIPVAFLIGFLTKKLQHITLLLALNFVLFFTLISFAKTKLTWYFMPILPGLSLLVGLLIAEVYEAVRTHLQLSRPWLRNALLMVMMLTIFTLPYSRIIQKVYVFEHEGYLKEKMDYRDFMQKIPEEKQYSILHPYYNGHVVFYQALYNLRGYQIQDKMLHAPQEGVLPENPETPPTFQQGEKVMLCETEPWQYLSSNYAWEIQREWKGCKLILVKGVRE